MRYLMKYAYLLLLLLGLAACSKEKVDVPTDGDSGNKLRLNITIQASLSDNSRTPVVEPDDADLSAKHHVSYVQLFVINDDVSDIKGEYQKVLFEKLYEWKQYTQSPAGQEAGYDKDKMTVEIDWKQQGDLLNAEKLRVIAVGYDATGIDESSGQPVGNSATAYLSGLSTKPKVSNEVIGSSMVSSEATQYNLIPRSEFYAGCSTSFTPADLQGIGKSGIEVPLSRRVAGFVGYFKNIPEDVKYIGIGTGHESKIYPISLPLLSAKQLAITDETVLATYWSGAKEGFIWTPGGTGDMILAPVKATDSQTQNGINSREGGTGVMNRTPDEELIEVTNGVARLSGFMIPMTISTKEYGKDVSTLMLNLYDENKNLIKSVKIVLESSVYPVNPSRAGTGIIEDEAERDPRYQYSICANEIYRIGTEDNPVSLDGSTSYVTLHIDNVWDEYYGGSMTGDKQEGIGIDTEWGDRPAGVIGSSANEN